jgi:hypothetical protein
MSNPRRENKLARFARLDGAEKWLLVRASAWLGVARLRLAFTSFQQLSERLSNDAADTRVDPDPEFLRRVSFAVAAAANNVPWRADCFPQAIAARMLLKRHGYASTIHFGVDRVGEDGLEGHAWLTCGKTVVTGGRDLDRYTEVHSFPL